MKKCPKCNGNGIYSVVSSKYDRYLPYYNYWKDIVKCLLCGLIIDRGINK